MGVSEHPNELQMIRKSFGQSFGTLVKISINKKKILAVGHQVAIVKDQLAIVNQQSVVINNHSTSSNNIKHH